MDHREQPQTLPALPPKIWSAASIAALIVGLSASSGLADLGAAGYPEYDIAASCRSEPNSMLTKRTNDCEDREYAVAIILRAQWSALAREQPDLVEACVELNATFDPKPSYLSLLQCVTRVRNAAD
ncbi:MAG: hypothetical protein EKK41_20670 [Hyphomicrobiales bacterium]|nr:MAG: hypothetical protein EKK41_20670 [Hyphomicrobiales bacterium]